MKPALEHHHKEADWKDLDQLDKCFPEVAARCDPIILIPTLPLLQLSFIQNSFCIRRMTIISKKKKNKHMVRVVIMITEEMLIGGEIETGSSQSEAVLEQVGGTLQHPCYQHQQLPPATASDLP